MYKYLDIYFLGIEFGLLLEASMPSRSNTSTLLSYEASVDSNVLLQY